MQSKSSRREALMANRQDHGPQSLPPSHFPVSRSPRGSSHSETAGGFHNIGNSCYINAVLCSLLALRPFTEDLRRVFASLSRFVSQPSVYEALHSLAASRARGDAGISTPRSVKHVRS